MQVSCERVRAFSTRKRKTADPRINAILESDSAVVHYFDYLRSKKKNKSIDPNTGEVVCFLSPGTKRTAVKSLRTIFPELGIKIEKDCMAKLIKRAETDPAFKSQIEAKLQALAVKEPLSANAGNLTYFKGIFHRNSERKLRVDVDNHFDAEHETISPLDMVRVMATLSHEEACLVRLLAYTGERPDELYRHLVTQIEPWGSEYYLVHSEKMQCKSRRKHYAIVPKSVMDPVLEICRLTKRRQLFPNYRSIWAQITLRLKAELGIDLTPKGLRTRFKTMAHDSGMPSNHWNFLEGSTPMDGANAKNYDEKDAEKFVREYNILLEPYLALDSTLRMPVKVATLGSGEAASPEAVARMEAKIDELKRMIASLGGVA